MRRILGVLVLCFGIAAAASADPVSLTSGTIQANDDYIGSFSLFGKAFAAEGSGIGAPIVPQFFVGPLDFSGDFGVNPVNDEDAGTVTAGGQTFRGFASASFQVVADPLDIPARAQGPQLFTTPFSARGQVQLFDSFRGGESVVQPGCHRQRNALVHRGQPRQWQILYAQHGADVLANRVTGSDAGARLMAAARHRAIRGVAVPAFPSRAELTTRVGDHLIDRATFRVILGLAVGIIDVLLMLPLAFPDKRTALLAAFWSRFALGFFATVVELPNATRRPRASWSACSRASRTQSSQRPMRPFSAPEWCSAQSRDGWWAAGRGRL